MVCDIAFLKTASWLTIQEQTQIAAHYEALNSIVEVQRWWHMLKDRHVALHLETIKNSHAKLMSTRFVNDKRRGCPSTSLSNL